MNRTAVAKELMMIAKSLVGDVHWLNVTDNIFIGANKVKGKMVGTENEVYLPASNYKVTSISWPTGEVYLRTISMRRTEWVVSVDDRGLKDAAKPIMDEKKLINKISDDVGRVMTLAEPKLSAIVTEAFGAGMGYEKAVGVVIDTLKDYALNFEG